MKYPLLNCLSSRENTVRREDKETEGNKTVFWASNRRILMFP